MTQKKVPFKREFKNFKESLRNPIGKGEYGLLFTDGSKFGRGEQLHFALQGVWEFQARNGRLPVPRLEDDANECFKYAKEINEQRQKEEGAMAVEEVDEKVVKLVAMFADTEFQPHACFFGGCLAQEAVKLAGK